MAHQPLRFAAAIVALAVGIFASGQARAIPFETAKIYIELNASAQDIGVQVFLDTDTPWKTLKGYDPHGNKVLDVTTSGNVGSLGVSEFFFESDEPPLNELSIAQFLSRFPAGTYTFVGESVDGQKLSAKAKLTHAIPDGPQVITPQEGSVVNPANAVISWQPVANPPGSMIVSYQVIVEGGSPSREFNATVPAATTSITVPAEFLKPATDYIFEVLAIEAGGNQTITEGSFTTQ
ncbi:MAG TPA: fibronectin type III domain-containing protein [Thermoanaerobaculia bacterium]|nr:fibronectin type III domain-containing protein [Thermoanaerobaculia bacterium]